MARSGAKCDASLTFKVVPEDCAGCFSLEFGYASPQKYFRWAADLDRDHAEFTGDLGAGKSTQVVGARFLSPEMSLSEAMFF